MPSSYKQNIDSFFDNVSTVTFMAEVQSDNFASSPTQSIIAPGVNHEMSLYVVEQGCSSSIDIKDINQGQIGDCFLLSSIGEIVLNKPHDITNMIKANADGTESVTLFEAASGALPTFNTMDFKPVAINVSNIFPSGSVNGGATQDLLGNVKEIWVQVLEKAIATLNGGYSNIQNGGSPIIAMEELTGRLATSLSPNNLSAITLSLLSNSNDLIVFSTAVSKSLLYNLIPNHSYIFEGISTTNAGPMIKLGNPWGYNQPAEIPMSQVQKEFVNIAVGHAS